MYINTPKTRNIKRISYANEYGIKKDSYPNINEKSQIETILQYDIVTLCVED